MAAAAVYLPVTLWVPDGFVDIVRCVRPIHR